MLEKKGYLEALGDTTETAEAFREAIYKALGTGLSRGPIGSGTYDPTILASGGSVIPASVIPSIHSRTWSMRGSFPAVTFPPTFKFGDMVRRKGSPAEQFEMVIAMDSTLVTTVVIDETDNTCGQITEHSMSVLERVE